MGFKFKVGQKVMDNCHRCIGTVCAIIKPTHHHGRRYVVVHDCDGFISAHGEENFSQIGIEGKEIEVKFDGVTYKAVIKEKVEETVPF